MEGFVRPLEAEDNDVARAGGKGSALSRLLRAGFPVPRGFVVTTEAFRAAATDREAVHRAIREALREQQLGVVAVRSSATAEDGAEASFAGQYETVLGVHDEVELRAAVERCWDSASSARALAYRRARGVESPIQMALVVQELVPADAAGVLFTADPLGEPRRVVIDAVPGLGEALVSGHATPDHYVVDRDSMEVVEARGPEERRNALVLPAARAVELAEIGLAIEAHFGGAVDVEWAIHESKWYVLQARPITAIRPRRETWNDSRSGDFLWSSGNLGEAVPDVMTPCTWSAVERFMADTMATSTLGPMRAFGNIGGRFYKEAKRLRAKAARWGDVVRSREAARSEVMRAFWVMRAFALRAGALLAVGTDIFMLSLDEILNWLEGRADHRALIPGRRATYEHYASLPRIPDLIRGRLDIERWAADPGRRTDLYVEGHDAAPPRAIIAGFPGSEGIVEGIARVLSSPEESDRFISGEVLVARVTNIGWTPLFPRARAVVTDVGAPLSHATIVARELGIPAVVGCGNATMLLRTGDRVRVDGGRGVVEKLEHVTDARRER